MKTQIPDNFSVIRDNSWWKGLDDSARQEVLEHLSALGVDPDVTFAVDVPGRTAWTYHQDSDLGRRHKRCPVGAADYDVCSVLVEW